MHRLTPLSFSVNLASRLYFPIYWSPKPCFSEGQANEGHCHGRCDVTPIYPFRTEGLFSQLLEVGPDSPELSAFWSHLHDERPLGQGHTTHTLGFPRANHMQRLADPGYNLPQLRAAGRLPVDLPRLSLRLQHTLCPVLLEPFPFGVVIPRGLSTKPLHPNLHLRICFPGNPICDRQLLCS